MLPADSAPRAGSTPEASGDSSSGTLAARMNRLSPKPTVIRALFARSGNECAFPGCNHPLVDDRHLFIGEVCHIRAVKPSEARHDPAASEESLREYDNLLLLCHAHHVRVDSLPNEYSVESLISIRENHQRSVEHRVYNVSEDTVDDALVQLFQSDWEPYFEPTIEALYHEIEEGSGGQQGMNQNHFQVGELLNAQLYFLLIHALSKSTLAERRRLLRDHRFWEMERDKNAHEASLEMEGGSGGPFLYAGSYCVSTRTRIETLRNQYNIKC